MNRDLHHQGDWLDATQMHALFNQVEIWIDKDLRSHRLEDMPSRYLRNMLAFVFRNYHRMMVYVNSSVRNEIELPGLGQEHESLKPLPPNPFDTPFVCAVRDELETRSAIDQIS